MQPRIATFRNKLTGRFRDFLREVSQKNPMHPSLAERTDMHREKPACVEPVSFEDRLQQHDSGRGTGGKMPGAGRIPGMKLLPIRIREMYRYTMIR